MLELLSTDRRVRFPTLYNIWFVRDEFHYADRLAIAINEASRKREPHYLLDDYSGRMYLSDYRDIRGIFGLTTEMDPYLHLHGFTAEDVLRVPFRRISVFAVDDLEPIEAAVQTLKDTNSDSYQILVRGQNRTYFLRRPREESVFLYGEDCVNEPSFLPSGLRSGFSDKLLESIWHSMADIVLHDVAFDAHEHKQAGALASQIELTTPLRHSPRFTLFALGLAQHYGLPSVGLDLTDSALVAAWFASHRIRVDEMGRASADLVEQATAHERTVFVFRCPKNTVFFHKDVRPDFLPEGRPDRQSAWFAHVGWGLARNQAANYLTAAFRLTNRFMERYSSVLADLTEHLFPPIPQDPVLEIFVKLSRMSKYEGETREMLKRIYYF